MYSSSPKEKVIKKEKENEVENPVSNLVLKIRLNSIKGFLSFDIVTIGTQSLNRSSSRCQKKKLC